MKKYFLTFANDAFKIQAHRIIKQARDTKWFDYCVSETPDSISEFVNEHKTFFDNNPKGFGCWIWKPYIILKWLDRLESGDILVYQDAGGSVIKSKSKRFQEYCQILEETPMIAFSVKSYKEKYFQRMDLLRKFNLDSDLDFLESASLEAGVVILRKDKSTIDFCQTWLDIMIEADYFWASDKIDCEKHKDFIEYREDQSIFSIIYKVMEFRDLDTESYGFGPFFSSRMSDNNLKDNAPDKFRIRDDYDSKIHLNYYLYQSDIIVRRNLEKEIKDYLTTLQKKLIYESVEEDLKTQFVAKFISFLDDVLYNFGLFSYTLIVDEDVPYTIVSRNILTGNVMLDIPAGFKIDLNFLIDTNKIEFTESPINRDNLFSKIKIEKTRVLY